MLNTLSATEMEDKISEMEKRKPEEFKRMRAWVGERIAASKKEPSAEVATLTPVLAQLLLENNSINRPISARNACDLSNDIAAGRYMFNGTSVSVSKTGQLLDGQHRCAQVVATGAAIRTVIVFGADDEARYTIDIGKPKTVSNFLSMKGKSYSHALGAAVKFHLMWREHNAIFNGGKAFATAPTKSLVLQAVNEMPGMERSVEFTAPSMKTTRSHAVLAFCHYIFWKRSSRDAADTFITKLIEGDGLRRGDPILYCRNRLLGMGRGVYAHNRIELIFKCWNAWRRGESIDRLSLGGSELPKLER